MIIKEHKLLVVCVKIIAVGYNILFKCCFLKEPFSFGDFTNEVFSHCLLRCQFSNLRRLLGQGCLSLKADGMALFPILDNFERACDCLRQV